MQKTTDSALYVENSCILCEERLQRGIEEVGIEFSMTLLVQIFLSLACLFLGFTASKRTQSDVKIDKSINSNLMREDGGNKKY